MIRRRCKGVGALRLLEKCACLDDLVLHGENCLVSQFPTYFGPLCLERLESVNVRNCMSIFLITSTYEEQHDS